MIIEQAIYGHSRGGHAFLHGSSEKLRSVFAGLAWRTDLPATAPSGSDWSRYVSGFPDDNFYVLASIAPDATAPRAGMVLSHALFLPIDGALELSGLQRATALLDGVIDRDAVLKPVELLDDHDVLTAPNDDAIGIAEALLEGGRLPVVFLGQEGFTSAVSMLWPRLPKNVKRGFSFRLSFSPQDVENDPQSVVCTPASFEGRWSNHLVVKAGLQRTIKKRSVGFLLGAPEGRDLANFANEIGCRIDDLKSLAVLEKSFELVQKSDSTIDETVAAVRLIGRLSPDPLAGAAFKPTLLANLENAVPRMTPGQVRSLRNLDLSAFDNSERLWNSLESWASEKLKLFPEDADAIQLWQDASSDTAIPNWTASIWGGLRRCTERADRGFSTALWGWWKRQPTLVDILLPRIPSNRDIEASLDQALSGVLTLNLADLLRPRLAERSWLKLHGSVLSSSMNARSALALQLEVDRNPSRFDGIEAALTKASDRELIAFALEGLDYRLTVLAARACIKAPSLFADFDPLNERWLQIFIAASETTSEIWRSVPLQESIIDGLIKHAGGLGKKATRIWKVVSDSPFADLSRHPRRRELWSYIPLDARAMLIAKTANSWLSQFALDPALEISLEPELAGAVCDEKAMQPFLGALIPDRITTGIRFFRIFTLATEGQFLRWYDQIKSRIPNGRLPESDAQVLGELISEKNWNRAASRLAGDASYRHDVRPALAFCYRLLGYFERLSLILSGINTVPAPSNEDLLGLFEETSISLYPRGPEENEIWSRAGGSIENLSLHDNGRARWHSAFRAMRNGGGDVTPGRLLAEMRKDFYSNEKLEKLGAHQLFRS